MDWRNIKEWRQLLFGFSGRINRAKFWLGQLVLTVVDLLNYALTLIPPIATLAVIFLGIPMIVGVVAISVKRLHDLGRTGYWLLAFALANGATSTIEIMAPGREIVLAALVTNLIVVFLFIGWLGGVRGTIGANQYGPDPVGHRPIADYDKAIQRHPNDAMAFNNRGDAHFEQGEYDRAIADYDQAIRLDPKADIAISNRGFAHLKMGRIDEAIADYNAALRFDSENEEALYGRGVAKLKKGDEPGGYSDIGAAKKIKPDIAEQFVKHGVQPD
jgi:uncharacterized membrane protein YhaH (DUF805 family)